jgi:hypothetical protein
MIKRLSLVIVLLGLFSVVVRSQTFVTTAEIFKRSESGPGTGQLKIIQDPALDTIMSRYILSNRNLEEKYQYTGIEGFRIQIYNSSKRDAKTESGKVRQEFMNQFPETQYPELISYLIFAEPAYYKVRVGNFRSRTEAMRFFLLVSKKFPYADLVPDVINLQDLNTK